MKSWKTRFVEKIAINPSLGIHQLLAILKLRKNGAAALTACTTAPARVQLRRGRWLRRRRRIADEHRVFL
jgi:hypothetical protein